MNDTTVQTAVRNYKDIFSFKKFAHDTLVKYYFPDQEVSTLNVGTIGFVTEEIGTGIEDSFFTVSTLIKEMFPNKAQLPESIFSYAAMFQLSNAFSEAAECKFLLVFEEDMIRKTIEAVNNQEESDATMRIFLDRDTKIIVEDVIFVLDYDIEISMKMIHGEPVYSAKYVTVPFKNSISSITNPYIKVRKSVDNYLALEVIGRQCIRDSEPYSIINNSKINRPIIDIPIVGKLAGFDILYKEPGEDDYHTQLETRVVDSLATVTPFCYYKMKDEKTLQISFSTMDNYFQPKFNSEILVTLYTTEGSKGKFDIYVGSNIEIVCSSERYWYNENMVFGAKVVSGSTGGKDNLNIDRLQEVVVEEFATANALTTDSDLEFYFRNYQYRYDNNIKFIKRRDDVAERLFSGYLIMKTGGYIYPTNTLDLSINYLDMYNPTKGYLYTLDPGCVFEYDGDSTERVRPLYSKKHMHIEDEYYRWCMHINPDLEYGIAYKDHPFSEWKKKYFFLEEYYELHKEDLLDDLDEESPTIKDVYPDAESYIHSVIYESYPPFPYVDYNGWSDSHISEILTVYDDEFIEYAKERPTSFFFSNPFLLALTVKPNIFGYYLTVMDKYSLLDFTNYNPNSFLQFIMNQLHVYRKLEKEKKYQFSIAILPSVKWTPEELVPSLTGIEVEVDENGNPIFPEDVDPDTPVVPTPLPDIPNGEEESEEFSAETILAFATGGNFIEVGNPVPDTPEGAVIDVDEVPPVEAPTTMTYYPHYTKNPLRVILAIKDKKNQECCYIELIPTEIDEEDKVTFTGEIYTDDHLSSTGNFRLLNPEKTKTPIVFITNSEGQMIPMENVVMNIYTLYREPETEYLRVTDNNFVDYDETLREYVWTNIFSTYSDPVTLIKPLNMVRSNVYFRDDRAVNINRGDVYVYSMPFLRHTILTHKKYTGEMDEDMIDKFNTFINQYYLQYVNMEVVLNSFLRNTSHIDLKFYNTFGKSKNYLIGEKDDKINRVNMSISFIVWVGIGTDLVAKTVELQNFIKETIEVINENGSNDFFVSNLIRKIENNFAYVDHLKFMGINEYDTTYQSIKNITKDIDTLSKDERWKYVPEMLVCNAENVYLELREME